MSSLSMGSIQKRTPPGLVYEGVWVWLDWIGMTVPTSSALPGRPLCVLSFISLTCPLSPGYRHSS